MTPPAPSSDLADCTATELLQLYKAGEASPVHATPAVFARIQALNIRRAQLSTPLTP